MSILDDTKYTSTSLTYNISAKERQKSHVLRFSSLPFCGRQYLYALAGLDPMTGMGDFFTSVGTVAHTVLQNAARRRVEMTDSLDLVRDWTCTECNSTYVFTPYKLSGLYEKGCHYCKAPSYKLKWDEVTVRYKSSAGHIDDTYLHLKRDGIVVETIDYKTCTSKAIYDHKKTGNVFPKYGNEFQLNGYTFLTKKIIAGHLSYLRSHSGYIEHPYPDIDGKYIFTIDNYKNIKSVTSSLVYVSRDNPMMSQRCEIGDVNSKKQRTIMDQYVEDYETTRKILFSTKPAEAVPHYCNCQSDFDANPYCPLLEKCQKKPKDAISHVESALLIIRNRK